MVVAGFPACFSDAAGSRLESLPPPIAMRAFVPYIDDMIPPIPSWVGLRATVRWPICYGEGRHDPAWSDRVRAADAAYGLGDRPVQRRDAGRRAPRSERGRAPGGVPGRTRPCDRL